MPTYADVGGPFADKLPVAPAMSVRNPLGRAEAQVAQLTNDLADLRREYNRAVSHLGPAQVMGHGFGAKCVIGELLGVRRPSRYHLKRNLKLFRSSQSSDEVHPPPSRDIF